MKNTEKTMDQIVGLCKGRGFVYPGSEIYGGLSNSWDYGPLGVELKNNVKKAWWKHFIQQSPHNVGLDCAILMNPQVWVASGHVGGFSDPLMDCKDCHTRHRADTLIENFCGHEPDSLDFVDMERYIRENGIQCPNCGSTNFTPIRSFNLMFKTFLGITEDSKSELYLRPETAQGIFVNFKNVQRTTRKKLPFGIGQIGKAFRNEITPGNFTFRTREFEQMELEFFCKPGTRAGMVRLLEKRMQKIPGEPGPPAGEPALPGPRKREAVPLLQRHHRHRIPLPLWLGRAVGRGFPHRFRPEGPPGRFGREHGVF